MDSRYAKFREQLSARMRDLLTRRGNNQQEIRELLEERHADIVDESSDLLSANTLEALSESELRELQAVAAALERYDAGEYGECVVCGDEIAEARLAIVPWTPMCIDCARAAEQRSRQFASGRM